MKKVRFLPLLLALSLPLVGCEKKNTPDQSQTQKEVNGILLVHAPSTIVQNETLALTQVTLDLSYSDGTTSQANPERISLDTASLGVKEGIAFYGSYYKTFSIEVVEQGGTSTKTFTELKDDVLTNHNYTLDIVSYYENFPEERYEGYMYNISNKAYFGKDPAAPNLQDSGFIKVKDQGIAKFYWSIANKEVLLDTFVVSNPDRTIYDIESILVEFLLEGQLTKVDDTHYTCSNQQLIGMMANFSGLELAYISNPEKLDIRQVGDSLKVELTLTANYYDEESLDPVENEPVYVGVTIKDIGSTHNDVIEAFVEDPSKKKANPTTWDAECLQAFAEHFDNFIPAFPAGASYTFYGFYDWDGIAQKNYIKCQDVAAGDLRTSYAAQLGEQGFELEQDNVYRRRVENSAHTLESIYEARFTYYPESGEYGDHTYGYYYKGGVFQVEFCYYTQLIQVVNSIESLNSYIATTAAKDIVPVFPEAYNDAVVTKFDDRTEAVNQQYPNSVLFATSSTGLFRIKIAAYEDAVTFYNELISRCEAKGFVPASGTGLFAGLTIATDEAESKITLTNMGNYSKESYEAIGYLECQIYIRNNYTKYYSVTLNKDDGVSSALITSPSNYIKVEEGTKVTFTVTAADGYDIDEITSSVEGVQFTKESETQYSFLMPASNITISVSTKSKAAGEGLIYDKEYVVYMGKSDNQPYYERPTTQGSIKLHFVFKDDGTGSYTYTWYNSSGTVIGGPYEVEFNYTLINGSFSLSCTKGGDNALYGNYRLFDTGDNEDNYNNTGAFENGEITITLTNGASSPTLREVTFK